MKKQSLFLLDLLLVLGFPVGAAWLFGSVGGSKPYVSKFPPRGSWAGGVDACNAYIGQAVAEGNASIDDHAAEFASFIVGRKVGAGSVSRELVCWYGKLRALNPYLPLDESNGHKQYFDETQHYLSFRPGVMFLLHP
jgi:hypothetical protein